MAVTRKGESGLALQFELIETARRAERRKEIWWLLGASLLIGAGLALALAGKSQDLRDAQKHLQSGQVLNLNELQDSEQLSPVLEVLFRRPADRDLVKDRLLSYLRTHRHLANVGALAHVSASRAEVGSDDRLLTWRKPASVRSMGSSVSLLSIPRMKPLVVIRSPRDFLYAFAKWVLLYFAAFWLVHLAWRWRQFQGDGGILPALHLLTGMGLILMISLRDPLRDTLEFEKFAWGVALGCLCLLLPLLRPFQYQQLAQWVYTPLITAFLLFFLLLRFGSGPTGSDARVNLGPFQPVEVIKILVVLFMAGYFAKKWEYLRELQERKFVPRWLWWLEIPRVGHAMPVMCAVACALGVFFALKDMGPALVTGMLFLVLFGVARRRMGLVLLGISLLVGGVAIGYHLGFPHTVAERVSMWLSPWDNDVRGGDQLAHSLWAFATGGVWGSGPGWGDPSVIPAGHTDLVLPSIAEEWGLPGLAAIGLLFTFLVHRALSIARRAPDEYGLFLGTGLGTLIALEMLLISGGALGAVPLSGVVSPFLSSGNTAMLANFAIFAILLSISNQEARAERGMAQADARLLPAFGRPLRVVATVLASLTVTLLARAAWIEVWRSNELAAKDVHVFASDGVKRPEHNPRLTLLAAEIPRGDIYDRNGILLATQSWTKAMGHQADYQKLGIQIEQACSPVDSRCYPFGATTLNLLGDLRTGERFHASNASLVEHDSNKRLQGYEDIHDLKNFLRYRHRPEDPALQALLKRNRDVRTSIDVRLQLKATEILKAHLARKAKKGALIVLDASTGDVLALVSWPTAATDQLDRSRYGEYPPGSAFKLVTAMAALRVDASAMRRTYACRRLPDGRAGTIIAGWRRPIRDDIRDHPHGSLTMADAITVSCNAYFAQLGVDAVGYKEMQKMATDLGIEAGTDLQLKQALPFAAYGQGPVLVTPLKMARVAATVAAGGRMPEGRWILDSSNDRNELPRQVITAASASFLANAMRSVVTRGTARAAMADLDVPVAGKTGTAQLDTGEPHSWFTGFAPFDGQANKRIAFAVVVEHGGYGAQAAAPIAKELVSASQELGIVQTLERR